MTENKKNQPQTAPPASLPGLRAAKPPAGKPKLKQPIIATVLILLLVKIGGNAWVLLSGPEMAQENPGSPVAITAITKEKIEPLKATGSPVVSEVDSYLIAVKTAISPNVVRSSTPAIATDSSIVPLDGLSSDQPAWPLIASATGVIPLPPGVNLLPATSLPQPALPVVNSKTAANNQQGPGLGSDNVGAAWWPPSSASYSLSPGHNQDVLKRKERALAIKEAELSSREEALKDLDADIRRRMASLESFRSEQEAASNRNKSILAEIKTLREERAKEDELQREPRLQMLKAAYGAMKPEQAGVLVNSLDEDVAAAILAIMPGRKAGMILANVRPEKAARLTKAISEKRLDADSAFDHPAGAFFEP